MGIKDSLKIREKEKIENSVSFTQFTSMYAPYVHARCSIVSLA